LDEFGAFDRTAVVGLGKQLLLDGVDHGVEVVLHPPDRQHLLVCQGADGGEDGEFRFEDLIKLVNQLGVHGLEDMGCTGLAVVLHVAPLAGGRGRFEDEELGGVFRVLDALEHAGGGLADGDAEVTQTLHGGRPQLLDVLAGVAGLDDTNLDLEVVGEVIDAGEVFDQRLGIDRKLLVLLGGDGDTLTIFEVADEDALVRDEGEIHGAGLLGQVEQRHLGLHHHGPVVPAVLQSKAAGGVFQHRLEAVGQIEDLPVQNALGKVMRPGPLLGIDAGRLGLTVGVVGQGVGHRGGAGGPALGGGRGENGVGGRGHVRNLRLRI